MITPSVINFRGRRENAIGVFYRITMIVNLDSTKSLKDQNESIFQQIHAGGFEPACPALVQEGYTRESNRP